MRHECATRGTTYTHTNERNKTLHQAKSLFSSSFSKRFGAPPAGIFSTTQLRATMCGSIGRLGIAILLYLDSAVGCRILGN